MAARRAGEEEPLKEVCNAACNPVRRRILEVLYDSVELPYGELARRVGVSENLLNHHLKRLNGLVVKGEEGYRLTLKGRRVLELIRGMERALGVAERGSAEAEALRESVSPGMIARRALAFLIDITLFFIATGALLDRALIMGLAGILRSLIALDPQGFAASLQMLVERSLVGYSNVFFASYIFLTLTEAYKGQTPGKHLLGLRVLRVDGGKVSLVEAGIRNAGKVFLLPVDLALGLILYRRLGYLKFTDYYTRTMVVREEWAARLPAGGGGGRG